MSHFILDPTGNNPTENDYLPVDDDVSLLRGVLNKDNLFIRGEMLCSWAAKIAVAREIVSTWRKSPVQELFEDCPDLTINAAQFIISKIGDKANILPRPLRRIEVLKELWPDVIGLWCAQPGSSHAFQWLSWCVLSEFTPEEEAFLRGVQEEWTINSSVSYVRCYEKANAKDAWQLIREWLGLVESTSEWPPPPTNIPKDIMVRLEDEWRSQLVRTGGDFFLFSRSNSSPYEVVSVAAKTAFNYFQTNPSFITRQRVSALNAYLDSLEIGKLELLLPPVDPGLPPDDFYDVVEWYKSLYLPFRVKASVENTERIKEIVDKFEDWFLKFYAQAITGSYGAEHLSWCKTAKLNAHSEDINLIVVLDGLSYRDGEHLIRLLRANSRRLQLDEISVLVSPLPTITRFAKPALMTGVNPSYAFDEDKIGPMEKHVPNVIDTLNKANSGDVVIWSLLEPDHTYHKHQDTESTLADVAGWLQAFSARLIEVASRVEASQKLKIVITTDHGRLLSKSQRLHAVPSGMEAQGRAAWGESEISFGEAGFVKDGDLVYLHPERFGIPQVCALLLNDESFVTSDGRGGTESFPHGGIYPEEVLIPWIQLSRDRADVIIEASLIGRGEATKEGIYTLEIVNTSEVVITIVELELSQIGFQSRLHFEVGAMSKKIKEIPSSYWPTTSETNNLEAKLVYVLPTGERRIIVIKPSLAITEMYKQEDILSDLL